MSFVDDKELQEYRRIMEPPEVGKFEDGFGWKAVAGAIFLGFIVTPATNYLSLVIGGDQGIGSGGGRRGGAHRERPPVRKRTPVGA